MIVKQRILFAILFFIAATIGSIYAQDKNIGTEFGIKGGFNISNLYSNDTNDDTVLYGFNAGVYATLPISDFIAIQPEILYSTKGSKLEFNSAVTSSEIKFKLDYIELPLLIRVNITRNFNIHAGGYAAYLIRSKISGNGALYLNNINTTDLNKFDAGLATGIGIDFNTVSLGVRYNYGLATVGKERTIAGTIYTFPDAKNNNLTTYISLKLN